MDNTIMINERVEVIARYRRNAECGSCCYPAKMKYQGHEVVFTELGLRHPTSKGRRMIHVFDMSDGVNDYRLEFDAEMLTWTLVAMLPGDMGEAKLQGELLKVAELKRRQAGDKLAARGSGDKGGEAAPPDYRRKTGRATFGETGR